MFVHVLRAVFTSQANLGEVFLDSSSMSSMLLWQPMWNNWSRARLPFPPLHPPRSNGEIRLQMENKELPSEEKAIMVWPDVQPNAKNSISHWKNKEQKQNKRPSTPYPFVMAWLLPSGSSPPACQRYHFLFECCERGAWSWVNGGGGGKGLSRAALTCLKHESSSTVFSHPIFPRLFLSSHFHKCETTMSGRLGGHVAWLLRSNKHANLNL